MEKEKKEQIETREYQSDFMKKILSGAPITNSEWFQYVANAKDCNPFTKNMSFERTIKVFMRICHALADFGPEWRAKGWPEVIDAACNHTLIKGTELIRGLMGDVQKNESKIEAMQKELNKLNFDTVPDLKRKLLQRDIENVYGGPCVASEEMMKWADRQHLIEIEKEEMERECIIFSMERHPGDLKAAAKELGMTQKALKSKLIKYGL